VADRDKNREDRERKIENRTAQTQRERQICVQKMRKIDRKRERERETYAQTVITRDRGKLKQT
jgi:hypothetical protein